MSEQQTTPADAAWDASEAWEAEYKAAFVAHAVTRGWDAENAALWAGDIAGDAASSCWNTCTPVEVAEVDVLECEKEDRFGT